jgi:RNA polymerase sigma factor (TIGR02999 family)
MSSEPGEVTQLLAKVRAGEPEAEQRLADLIYKQLRKLASAKMRGERPNHTLTPTALANEAWMQLRDFGDFQNRQHFLAIAANAMRRILIDHARARNARKREGTAISLDEIDIAIPQSDDQLLELDEALLRLSEVNVRAAQVVELRHFGGLQQQEIADYLNVDRRTVDRDWKMARAWLFNEMSRR